MDHHPCDRTSAMGSTEASGFSEERGAIYEDFPKEIGKSGEGAEAKADEVAAEAPSEGDKKKD